MQQLAALVAGLGFACLERLLTMGPAGRYLEATFKANKDLPAGQVRPAVHQAATNLVGLLHVFIVVGHLASACRAPKRGTSITYGSSLTLSGSSTLLVHVCTGADDVQHLNTCKVSNMVASFAGAAGNLSSARPQNDQRQIIWYHINIHHHAGCGLRLLCT